MNFEITGLFGPTTTAQAMRDLDLILKDLRKVAEDRTVQALECRAEAERLLVLSEQHELEAAKAEGVYARLATLLGDGS